MLVVGTCLVGGLGAALRVVVDGWVRERMAGRFPLGTFVVNVTGSFLLGMVAGVAGGLLPEPGWTMVLGTGLLGGYTTFSTASVEATRLLQAGDLRGALGVGLGTLLASVVAASAGLGLGLLA